MRGFLAGRMLRRTESYAAGFQEFAGRAQQGEQAAAVGDCLSEHLGLGVDEIILGLKDEESSIDSQGVFLLFGIEPLLREAEDDCCLFNRCLG